MLSTLKELKFNIWICRFAVLPHGISLHNFVANGPPFAGAPHNGNNSMMNMIMNNGCMPSGSTTIVQQMPGSSRMGVVNINQQMSMTHLRPLTRFASDCKKLTAGFRYDFKNHV